MILFREPALLLDRPFAGLKLVFGRFSFVVKILRIMLFFSFSCRILNLDTSTGSKASQPVIKSITMMLQADHFIGKSNFLFHHGKQRNGVTVNKLHSLPVFSDPCFSVEIGGKHGSLFAFYEAVNKDATCHWTG